MHHQEFESPEQLQSVIKCFWHNKWDTGDIAFEVLPDGYAEIIFYFGAGLSVSIDGILQPLPSPFMVGLLSHPAYFQREGMVDILGIRCFPWTIYDMLGLPSGKDGVRVFKHSISLLQSALTKCIRHGRIEDALTLLKSYFLNTRPNADTNQMLSLAGMVLRGSNGTIEVSQVAKTAHASVRTLQRTFKHYSGYSVKDVSTLIRFEKVRNQLWLNPDVNISGLAYEAGYTDQSHLSRDFKRYTGTTPAVFARKVKKERTALDNDFVAFIQE